MVLLVGGTGRTGGRVLAQLLDRGVEVRAIVRSAGRLPGHVTSASGLHVVEADLHALTSDELGRHLEGCDTVISCLGHTLSLRGIFGPPFDLVARFVSRVVSAARARRDLRPTRLILMSTVAVEHPGRMEPVRGAGQRAALWLIRTLAPPARDNQRAAELLALEVGPSDPAVAWVAVRPDALREGGVTEYRVHEELVDSVFSPGETNMSNVAHFMCELTCDETQWRRWRGRMPVVVNDKSRH